MIADFQNDLLGGKTNGVRLPVLGNIRSGIKRLKAGYTEADETIYNKMVAAGAPWHEIEERLGKDGNGKTKLVPQNTDHFTVRSIDCMTNPENAHILHDLYADDDGHIRHFPIVFLSDSWYDCIPHELVCWGAKELKYRSKYKAVFDATTGERGFERVCMTPESYKKGVRPFGGRDYREARPCTPQSCPDYQKGYCKLKGFVEAIIPGTKGAGVWRIGTGSIYSFLQMRQQLEMVQRITNRIQGLINEKTGNPIFWLRKVTDSISRVDVDKGEALRAEQDLIYLEADIDLYELITNYQPTAILERGQRAAAALTGKCEPEPAPETAKTTSEPTNGAGASTKGTTPEETPPPTDDDFHPQVELSPEEGERRAIVQRIFNSWSEGRLSKDQKKTLKEQYPMDIEKMGLTMLKDFEGAIVKLFMPPEAEKANAGSLL